MLKNIQTVSFNIHQALIQGFQWPFVYSLCFQVECSLQRMYYPWFPVQFENILSLYNTDNND